MKSIRSLQMERSKLSLRYLLISTATMVAKGFVNSEQTSAYYLERNKSMRIVSHSPTKTIISLYPRNWGTFSYSTVFRIHDRSNLELNSFCTAGEREVTLTFHSHCYKQGVSKLTNMGVEQGITYEDEDVTKSANFLSILL